ncbi:hypothetical protein MNEG_11500, partial [Monoraphidium neglectum]
MGASTKGRFALRAGGGVLSTAQHTGEARAEARPELSWRLCHAQLPRSGHGAAHSPAAAWGSAQGQRRCWGRAAAAPAAAASLTVIQPRQWLAGQGTSDQPNTVLPLMLALQPATPRFLNPTGGAAASRRKPDRSNHQQRRADRQPARAGVATDEGTPVDREQARPGTSPRSTAGPAAMLGAAVENAKLVVAGALSAAVSRTAVAPLER